LKGGKHALKFKSTKNQIKLLLVLVAVLWGVNPTIVKLGIQSMPAISYTALRLFVATLAFSVQLYASKTFKWPEKRDWIFFIFIGMSIFSFQISLIFALRYVSAGTAATMISLMPISVLIINHITKKVGIKKYHYLGAFVTLIGILLISNIKSSEANRLINKYWIGIGLLLISQFAAASQTVISERLVKRYSHYQVAATMFGIAFFAFAFLAFGQLKTMHVNEISKISIFCIVYGGIFSIYIANTLWTWGVKQIGSHETAIYNNLSPIFSLLSGMIILKEMPSIIQIIGVGLILTGLFIFNHLS
jgi:O-acetylserine/cysteine efflux transporter